MTATTNLAIALPTVGGSDATWGTIDNAAFQSFDDEYKVTTLGDAGLTADATTRIVRLTTTLTTGRTITLPAASGRDANKPIVILDIAGAVSSTNTLTIARAGSDTINGLTSISIGGPYQAVILRSDGTSKWIATVDGLKQKGTWTPTIAPATVGTWSVSYGAQTGVYFTDGSLVYLECALTFTPTVGTGSGNLIISGLPFTMQNTNGTGGNARVIGTGWTWPAGLTQISVDVDTSTTLRLFATGTASAGSILTAASLTSGVAHQIRFAVWYIR